MEESWFRYISEQIAVHEARLSDALGKKLDALAIEDLLISDDAIVSHEVRYLLESLRTLRKLISQY
jgi:hypothetical protein